MVVFILTGLALVSTSAGVPGGTGPGILDTITVIILPIITVITIPIMTTDTAMIPLLVQEEY